MTNQNPEARFHNPDFPDEIVNPDYPDRRNVIDHYRLWTQDAIREDLQATALPLTVVAENFAHDFNIATLVRNSNAFNARQVDIVGRKQWDKRGAVGTYLYTPVNHHYDAEAYYAALAESNTTVIAFDNVDGAVDLPNFEWPDGEVAIIFGQESIGVSNLALARADHVVQIPQRGSVRSLNVGTASGIVLYDYATRGGY